MSTSSSKPELLKLENFLPFRLNRLSESVSLRFAQHYRREYGMTRPEWRTLAVLGQHGIVTSTDICHYSTMHKTKVSRAVQSLAQRGWLVRLRDQQDRRVEHLQLNTRGQKHYMKLVALARHFETDLLKPLSKSEVALVEKTMKLLESLQTDAVYTADQ